MVLVELLADNRHLEELCLTGARVREHMSWLSVVIMRGRRVASPARTLVLPRLSR